MNKPFAFEITACDGDHIKRFATLEELKEVVQRYAKGTYWGGVSRFSCDGIRYEVVGATLADCGVTRDEDFFCRVA